MQEIALTISIFLSGIVLGLLVLLFAEARIYRQWYKLKHAELEELMKKAADAQLTFADKILQMEEKINNIEFWKASSTTPRGR